MDVTLLELHLTNPSIDLGGGAAETDAGHDTDDVAADEADTTPNGRVRPAVALLVLAGVALLAILRARRRAGRQSGIDDYE